MRGFTRYLCFVLDGRGSLGSVDVLAAVVVAVGVVVGWVVVNKVASILSLRLHMGDLPRHTLFYDRFPIGADYARPIIPLIGIIG